MELKSLLTGGWVADLLAAVILLEVLLLAWRAPHRLGAALPGLGAGLALALALRCVLTGTVWPWLPLCLLAAGAAHAVDMQRVWRR